MNNPANDGFKRFDMTRKPIRQRLYLRPITKLLSYPDVRKHKAKLNRINTDGLKPPYVLLCNHNAFIDFKVTTRYIYPARANYVVAIDGFIGREWLLRNVGCICKRKFTNDIVLVRQLQQVIKNGDIAVIYPEARYSLCGTNAVLPDSLGKMCKLLRVPVVTLIMHGHHVNSPFWNLHDRGVKPIESEFEQIFTAEQLAEASVDEVNRRINEKFTYDDFRWQKERGIKVTYKKRAEGLDRVLYQCPACETEYRMTSKNDRLRCEACGKEWVMSELGELSAAEGATEFSHIPDWYEWERAQVREQVENGTYKLDCDVLVRSLPNAKKYITLGMAHMTHDKDGFVVRGKTKKGVPFEMIKPVASMYSCHIEYNYLGKFGDCVDLNTLTDTWYCYPQGEDFSVTKAALATEELYAAHMRAVELNKRRKADKAAEEKAEEVLSEPNTDAE